jgi:hypothetical protein
MSVRVGIGRGRTIPKLMEDGAAGETIEDEATHELRIGALDLFQLFDDVLREAKLKIERASLPHDAFFQ